MNAIWDSDTGSYAMLVALSNDTDLFDFEFICSNCGKEITMYGEQSSCWNCSTKWLRKDVE